MQRDGALGRQEQRESCEKHGLFERRRGIRKKFKLLLEVGKNMCCGFSWILIQSSEHQAP